MRDREGQPEEWVQRSLAIDPLDWWARFEKAEEIACDFQVALDLALDCARAGLFEEGSDILRETESNSTHLIDRSARGNGHPEGPLPTQSWGAVPMLHYCLGWLQEKMGHTAVALEEYRRASALPPDYCFPARLEEIAILEAAMRANPKDARAPYYLGNLLYDRRRHEEGIRMWERAAKLDPTFSIVWRNLGIGYFNIRQQPAKARAAYDKAFKANPGDARLLYERDQLWKRLGESPTKRLKALEAHPELVRRRDDLTVELCSLYTQVGRPREALELLSARHFQPWEGGEGGPLGQYTRANLALGREALAQGESTRALVYFEAALTSPANLGEAKHLLANQSDLHYWLGCASEAVGEKSSARKHWLAAAMFKGDFQEMSVRSFSEMTYFSALSWMRLGRKAIGRKLLKDLLAYAVKLTRAPAKIDYFATSLPTMLLFEDDLQFRQGTTALFLEAQARLGLGNKARARILLRKVLTRDPNHALATDHLRDVWSSGAGVLPATPGRLAHVQPRPKRASN
jgi:tetratricopeptide (TPR) repeat protein